MLRSVLRSTSVHAAVRARHLGSWATKFEAARGGSLALRKALGEALTDVWQLHQDEDEAKAMEDAYFLSRSRGQDDAELDLGNHDPEKPKIGHHWARRKSDQVARDTMDITKTTPETIDEAFGWDQKQAKRKQQLHYAGSTALLKLCRVTMML